MDRGKLQELRRQLRQREAENRARLRSSPQSLWSVLAEWNALYARLTAPWCHPLIHPAVVGRVNQHYCELFPHSMNELVQAAVCDPCGYEERIARYETRVDRPCISFETNCRCYRQVTWDPLRRQEENFLLRALLGNPALGGDCFRALDIGTGYGRLCFRMCQMLAECCVPEGFGVVGVDIRRDNIIDALQERKGQPKCERAFFLVADGTREPLRSGSFDLGCLASALHLVPVYERPFQLLELIRVLRPGGEGVLTGPNENFSGEEYIRWSIGHCPELFASGWDLSGLHRFVQAGMLIAELVRKRLDFRAPSTADLCTTLNDMGCSVICVDTWPGRSGSGRDFFTGVRFAVTEKAKKIARTFEKDGS